MTVGRALCLLLASVAFFVNTWPGHAQSGAPFTPYAVERIAEDLYTFRWGAYRSLFVVSDDGVIVTDPMNPEAARVYREEIARLTDQPVKYVVYSHSHWDRAAGAQIFKDEGAEIVAQERCVDDFALRPHADIVEPDITFSDSYEVSVGERSLALHYFGPVVGNCFIVMQPKPSSHLFIVDLVQPPTGWEMPWNAALPDHHIYNIVPFLNAVEELAANEQIDTLIGGFIAMKEDASGKQVLLPPTGPISVVTERREFFEQLMGDVKAQLEAAVWSEFVPGKIDLAPYESLERYEEGQFKILVWRIAHYYYSGR